LSEIIQSYLEAITKNDGNFNDEELNSIKGTIKLADDFDLKAEIQEILIEKNLK